MELSQSHCGKHHGGVLRIALYDASRLISVPFDPSSGCYSSIEVEEGYTPIEVAFAEESGAWSERVGSGGGVEHSVEFSLWGARCEALSTLQTLSERGVVALVECADGGQYLVGYSPRATTDYPLRLAEGNLNTFSHRTERPTTNVLLTSTDGWFSRPLLGE